MVLPPQLHPRLPVRVTASFVALLAEKNFSIAVTLVPGRLALIGLDAAGRLAIDDTLLDAPWGLAVHDQYLAIATRRDIALYAANRQLAAHHPGKAGQYEAYYAPRVTHSVGYCQVHDLWLDDSGLYGVNTRFSAICRFDDARHSFTPVWRPPFITALQPQDRCHLNGMAWDGGKLAYATAFGVFDEEEGWRGHAPDQGVVMDTGANRVLASGLCLPHSPRVIGGRLYLTEMGAGRLLAMDRDSGRTEVVAQLGGMTRGLGSIDGIAIVGLSQARKSFLEWRLPMNQGRACVCGLAAVDLATGAVIGTLEFAGGIEEVFDLQILPGTRRAGILDLSRWDGYFPIDVPGTGFWTGQTAPT